jgi:hypothetical protein
MKFFSVLNEESKKKKTKTSRGVFVSVNYIFEECLRCAKFSVAKRPSSDIFITTRDTYKKC